MEIVQQLTGCGLMLISLGWVCTFWFRTMFALDKLIKHEFEHFPAQWDKDGQPQGMFWKPSPDSRKLVNRLFVGNPGFVSFRWLFRSPAWVNADDGSAALLRDFRRYSLWWNLGALALFFIVFPAILIVFTPR